MHFDDRLETVLRLPDSGDGLARIQFRQLVDILGRLPADAASDALEAGFARLQTLSTRIPAADRARLLRRPLQPIANARVIALLAEAEPEVASAAIASARLGDGEWLALIPRLPVRARGILRHRRDLPAPVERLLERLGVHDRGLPPLSGANPAFLAGDRAGPAGVLDLDDDLAVAGDELPRPTSLNEWARARAAREPAAVTPAEAGIGAIVRRIEEFRKAREARGKAAAAADSAAPAPGVPVAVAPRRALTVDFATDANGRVNWADGAHAPALFGLDLASLDDGGGGGSGVGSGGHSGALASAIRRRLPLHGVPLRIDGAPLVSGEWQVDAAPRFDPAGGRFTGYCGRLRRPPASPGGDAPAQAARREGDRMREILHELRTPANAIQVAAEIIQQQLYGPAPHEYRALAAAIASDCAHILAGFEELDRLVKLEAGALVLDQGECDLAQVIAQTVARLDAWTRPRRSGFVVDPATGPASLPVRIDRAEAERLVWRLLAALAGATAPDEALGLTWSHDQRGASVQVELPRALAERSDDALFGAPAGDGGQSPSAGMFGIGFSLRLAAAEAAAAGGGLGRINNGLQLVLPVLTVADTGNTTIERASH